MNDGFLNYVVIIILQLVKPAAEYLTGKDLMWELFIYSLLLRFYHKLWDGVYFRHSAIENKK